ncbi:MAG: DUF962 domain-containing protein [Pyrinomonadaceae bacterium]|nr:DUF962 domain-containing protein [Pyrinomonadaceae bacterium]
MSNQEMKTFEEFWPHYVAEHSKPETRALHFVGTTVGMACAAALIARGKWRWLPVAFVPGYAAAWTAHFFIEHNRPATFEHPLWSLMADYKMVGLMLAGKMTDEAAALAHTSHRDTETQRQDR